MKIETLKKSHLKRNIIIGVVGVLIISAIILNFTKAKFRTTQSIPLVNGMINYTPYDFKVMAMYQENDNGEYVEIETMPSSGYSINESESYCTIDNVNHDEEAILYTNDDGEHVIGNLKKNSKCYLYFDEELSGSNTILANYPTVLTRDNFRKTVTETTTGTIYKSLDSSQYDNDGEVYYFAGNPTDNWVYFANFYWRIIRINGDGTIRLIYQGNSANTTGEATQITTSAFNNGNYTYHAGLSYNSTQHGLGKNSTILTALYDWYESSNLNNFIEYIDKDTGFCGDRNMASGYTWSSNPSDTMYYATYERINNGKPIFKCNSSSDLYTNTDSANGNRILTYPIGLITADEANFAGIWGNTTSNYLYTGENYWTMSPSGFISYVTVFVIAWNGSLASGFGDWSVNDELGVRPVINLKADITISSGDGTSSNPYVIATT